MLCNYLSKMFQFFPCTCGENGKQATGIHVLIIRQNHLQKEPLPAALTQSQTSPLAPRLQWDSCGSSAESASALVFCPSPSPNPNPCQTVVTVCSFPSAPASQAGYRRRSVRPGSVAWTPTHAVLSAAVSVLCVSRDLPFKVSRLAKTSSTTAASCWETCLTCLCNLTAQGDRHYCYITSRSLSYSFIFEITTHAEGTRAGRRHEMKSEAITRTCAARCLQQGCFLHPGWIQIQAHMPFSLCRLVLVPFRLMRALTASSWKTLMTWG